MSNPYQRTHGMSRTKIYDIWQQMLQRVQNQKNHSYPDYGGRGIRVCERWLSFPNFYADMGDRPAGMLLERINNDGHYEPGNCKWATPMEQQNNTRYVRLLTHNGETLSMSAWARKRGLSMRTLCARLNLGWTVHEALTMPPIPHHQCRGRLSPREQRKAK